MESGDSVSGVKEENSIDASEIKSLTRADVHKRSKHSSKAERELNSLCELPRSVVGLRGLHIVQVACGKLHSLALTQRGEVYSWGCNSQLQCGVVSAQWFASWSRSAYSLWSLRGCVLFFIQVLKLQRSASSYSTKRTISQPTKITHLDGTVFHCIACGDSHSLAATAFGIVYAWGSNDHGQLGLTEKGRKLSA